MIIFRLFEPPVLLLIYSNIHVTPEKVSIL